MTTEILSQLIYVVALAIVSLVFWALRELVSVGITYLRSKLGETEYARLKSYATDTVKALEQSPIYKGFDGAKKKELAKVAILQFAQQAKLPIDDAMVEKFIEAAVQEMNTQMSGIDWVAGEILSSDNPGLVGSTN